MPPLGQTPSHFETRGGQPVHLGAELGRGGEGAVLEVVGRADVVGKVYLAPVARHHAAKIEAMVRSRTGAIEEFTAWPVEELLASGSLRGFLMQRVPASFRPIHALYGPKSRATEFPGTTWAFLGHVAMNVCRTFAAVHDAGHIVGDVNHDNIRVNPKGVVRLIDCDSFQVANNGVRYRCRVGVPTHTPPELQGVQLDTVDRLPEHDAFGLAVVLFQLLLMGRHPFAGRYLGPGEMPLERAISEYRFAYGPNTKAVSMEAPPNTVGLDILPERAAKLFRRAFERGTPSQRPSPAEWLDALEDFRGALSRCGQNPLHFFRAGTCRCPWCDLEARVGVSLFGVAFVAPAPTGQAFSVVEYENRLYPLRAVLTLSPIPQPLTNGLAQAPQQVQAAAEWAAMRQAAVEQARRWTAAVATSRDVGRVCQWPAKAALAIGAVPCLWPALLAMAAQNAGATGAVLAALAGTFGLGQWFERRDHGPGPAAPTPPPLVAAALDQLARAEQDYRLLAARWQALNTGTAASTIAKAQGLCDEYKAFPQVRERRLAELSRTARERQLAHFLGSHRIERASIPDIGPSRTATLRSYGIETAADIDPRLIRRIDGFGEALTGRLRWWRESVERNFRFDPTRNITPADLSALDAEIARARSKLAVEIQASVSAAEQERRAAEAALVIVQNELTAAAARLANARVAAAGMT